MALSSINKHLIITGTSFTVLNIDNIERVEISSIKLKAETGHLEIVNTHIASEDQIAKIETLGTLPT